MVLRRRLCIDLELETVAGEFDRDRPATFQVAEQDLVGQPVADLGLDQPRQRARTERLIVAALGQPATGRRIQHECHATLAELRFEPNGTIASRRLRNSGRNTFSIAAIARARAFLAPFPPKPIPRADNSLDPAFEVMIRTTWRKSARRPVLSVRVA